MAPKSKSTKPQGVVKRKHVAVDAQRLTRSTSDGHAFLEYKNSPKAFIAFQVEQEVRDKSGNRVTKKVVVSPETGIHSFQWAQAILPQAGLPSLPIEIRNKIYHFLFLLWGRPHLIPTWSHRLSKYANTSKRLELIPTYNALSLVCRQFFIEVIGSGLLYKLGIFHFRGPEPMRKYLSNINPFHKSLIRGLHLDIQLKQHRERNGREKRSHHPPHVPKTTIALLASIPSLMYLKLSFQFIDAGSKYCSQFLEQIDDEAVWMPLKGKFAGIQVGFKDLVMLSSGTEEYKNVGKRILEWVSNGQGTVGVMVE